MTAFRRRYLDPHATKPLVIVDLGSQDIRGSYRAIFDRPPWRYVGVDIVPGKNVELIIRDPYNWRELKSNSVDVLISGQTFEHTEFFWETAGEIERVLKPNGLCCLIAPWTGPVHRYPLDCWRMNCDGMLAIARYAGLEVLEAWTQTSDSPKYDADSNQWHESILIVRKREGGQKFRERIYRWSNACVRNVRVDFSGPQLRLIEIASLRVADEKRNFLEFPARNHWNEIELQGDAERLESAGDLRIKTEGIDPQLHFPTFKEANEDLPLFVEMQARAKCESS